MTPEMLAKARRAAAEAELTNVEFVEGEIEALPFADATFDVVLHRALAALKKALQSSRSADGTFAKEASR